MHVGLSSRARRLAAPISFVLAAGACAGCASSDGVADAGGGGRDAGAMDGGRSDAGLTSDAAVAADSAPPADAEPPTDAALLADAGPPLPPFPELAVGPYRHLLAMLVDSVEANAAALDTSRTYSQSAGQGYVLQAIGALLWAARGYSLPARDRLIELALGEIAELRLAADRTTGAAPAFGLEAAWDAFGDGSTNPAFTAYTWQSGMVALGVASIARVLDDLGHPSATETRDFGVALVQRWDAHHTVVAGAGGYWWYSTEPSDAIAVHNTSALVAMASQLLSEHGGPASLATWPRAAADLLWARTSGNPTTGYRWNYADDGYPVTLRRAEDVSHALVTLQLMRFAGERGWWSASQMQGVAATLLHTMWTGNPARLTGLVDGTRTSGEWTDTQAAVIGYAAHGDAPGGDPEVFDVARSILFSSYLSRYDRALDGATVDSARTLALALLLAHRPAVLADGSRWEREAGPGDDAVPVVAGGVRFYTVDWAAPASLAAGGLTLPARAATAANANLLVDLDDTSTGRVIVSLTYRCPVDTSVAQWNGTAYVTLASLPATVDEAGTPRWFRTTFELAAAPRFDYQAGVPGTNVLLEIAAPAVAVHRIEATPL